MTLDWRESSQYPNPSDLSGAAWAWQFLRRNPRYIDDYSLFKDLPDIDPVLGANGGKFKGLPRHGSPLDCWYTHPPSLTGETLYQFLSRMEREEIRDIVIKPFADYLSDEYLVWPPIDPQVDEPEYISFSHPINFFLPWEMWPYRAADVGEAWEKAVDPFPTRTAVVFDVSLPLKRNMDAAEAILRERKQLLKADGVGVSGSRLSETREILPLYLRFLDWAASGESLAAAAAVFYPTTDNYSDERLGSKKVASRLRTAQLYRDRNYWQLALHD